MTLLQCKDGDALNSKIRVVDQYRLKRLFVCLAFAIWVCVSVTTHANAQTASFRAVDTNSDGILNFDELVDAFGRDGAATLLRRSDHNGDSRLSISELRRDRDSDRTGGDRERDSRNDRGDRDDDDGDDRDDDDRDDDDGGDDDGGDDDGGGDDGGDGGDGGGDDGGDDD